jgi:type II secretory ATPase GspE/PulE/Tfp pilus assembly ATPase PilB-like protein
MSFAAISTTLKRRRYDFVMIAEARDQESVDAAFSSAANGKMTGMTLHAGDAIAAPEKLSQEYSVPVTRQAEHIKLIIAQRLVRRLCSDCKAASIASDALLRFRPSARGATVYTPVGCVVCNGTGFRRELAVFEKFRPTDEFWKAARDGAVASELHAIALESGFRPMFEHGLDRVLAGETSLSEVVKAVPKPR